MFIALTDQFPAVHQQPHYLPYPPSFFDMPDESLDVFATQMIATDLAMQTPSPSFEASGWISELPSPTSHYDAGVYFNSPLLDVQHVMPNNFNQLHPALVSEFHNDSRQNATSVFRSDCSLVDSDQSKSPFDIFWPVQFTEEISTPASNHIRPTCLLPTYNGADPNGKCHPTFQRDPWAMRNCLMLQAKGKPLNKAFRKSAKDMVASPNTRKASSARRKYAPKFKCPIDGCNDDFTRKHNLDNHLRSHCGITDLICDVCHQGFTTIPVLKRHKKNCRHPS